MSPDTDAILNVSVSHGLKLVVVMTISSPTFQSTAVSKVIVFDPLSAVLARWVQVMVRGAPNRSRPPKTAVMCTETHIELLLRRLRGDQIEVFKILNGYENIDRNMFFSGKEERRTRAHGFTLAKKKCRLDIKKFSFSQRTVNEWNRLSADCVGASSVNMFKNKIDIYLRRAGYI